MSEAAVAEKPVSQTAEPVSADATTQVEEPVFDTADAYLESLSPKADTAFAVEETRPRLRSPLEDPKAIQYAQDYRSRHAERQRAMDATADELVRDYGVPEAMARRIVNSHKEILNSHNNDGLNLAGYASAMGAVQYEQAQMTEAMARVLPKPLLGKLNSAMQASIDATGIATYQDTFKTMLDLAREGYTTEKDNKEAVKKAFEAGRVQGRRDGTTTDNSNRANGRVVSAPVLNSKMPKNKAELVAGHARGDYTNEQYRQWSPQLH